MMEEIETGIGSLCLARFWSGDEPFIMLTHYFGEKVWGKNTHVLAQLNLTQSEASELALELDKFARAEGPEEGEQG